LEFPVKKKVYKKTYEAWSTVKRLLEGKKPPFLGRGKKDKKEGCLFLDVVFGTKERKEKVGTARKGEKQPSGLERKKGYDLDYPCRTEMTLSKGIEQKAGIDCIRVGKTGERKLQTVGKETERRLRWATCFWEGRKKHRTQQKKPFSKKGGTLWPPEGNVGSEAAENEGGKRGANETDSKKGPCRASGEGESAKTKWPSDGKN